MKKGWFIAGLLTLVLIGAGVGGAISYGSVDTLPDNFIVGGLNVGGQSAEEALKEVREQVAKMESTSVSVDPKELGDDGAVESAIPSLTLKQLGLKVDAAEAMNSIERFRDYSWWERAKLRYRGDIESTYGMKVSWDDGVFDKAAGEAWGSLVTGRSENAARTINDQDIVVYTEEKLGRQLDLPALFEQLKKHEPANLTAVPKETLLLETEVIETPPEITVAKLKEEGIERKIVEFTTSFATSGEGRTHNVTVAAKALNETLLMPDEVFEYGKIVAKAEKEFGYKEAPVILKGKLTPGIGGGICQVSSTLYNAALLTGLDIVERRNHSLVVHYLPKGLDATFADGYVNFKFRNSTGKQLLIRTVVKDKTLTVKFFGTMPDNVSYRTETEEVKVNPPKTVYVANAIIAPGKQDTMQKGEAGYVVESYLVKLVDGEFVERKKLSKDTYRSQDTLIAVNPSDPRLHPEGATPTPTPSETPDPDEDEGPVEPV
ncbi:VanW family protein [Cohnella luojiensis]|nr:VanW family protein [Cohnella luojiensis]